MLIRPFDASTDSVPEITSLLHRAYAPLAAAGLHFVAAAQSEKTTRDRMAKGEPLVGVLEGRIVATATWYAPGRTGGGTPWYERVDVAKFGQFAVEPSLQGGGHGRALERYIAASAAALGARELALDTSEKAAGLIAMYSAWGYRFIEHCQWRAVNYRSMVMSRALHGVGSTP